MRRKDLKRFFRTTPLARIQRWLEFNRRFEARFHEKPEQFALLAYDAMNALLDSICKAGLNRDPHPRRAGEHRQSTTASPGT